MTISNLGAQGDCIALEIFIPCFLKPLKLKNNFWCYEPTNKFQQPMVQNESERFVIDALTVKQHYMVLSCQINHITKAQLKQPNFYPVVMLWDPRKGPAPLGDRLFQLRFDLFLSLETCKIKSEELYNE